MKPEAATARPAKDASAKPTFNLSRITYHLPITVYLLPLLLLLLLLLLPPPPPLLLLLLLLLLLTN